MNNEENEEPFLCLVTGEDTKTCSCKFCVAARERLFQADLYWIQQDLKKGLKGR